MNTVLVFKTSVQDGKAVKQLRSSLNKLINSSGRWNFDLEDCDNILRVETQHPHPTAIISALKGNGFFCEEL